ncbi:MAG: choice-of-anchor Q domain-containing protein [Rhodanobacteraceae bacterium]
MGTALALACGALHAAAERSQPYASRDLPDPDATGKRQRLEIALDHAGRGAAQAGGGTYWPVTNCADSGEGSMRAAVESAVSGDTIEAIGLSCSTVTLSTAIVIDADDLTIEGAGPGALTITNGAKYGRVFTHNGNGTLQLLGMTISSGLVSPLSSEADSRGGCVFSSGSVALGNIFDPTNARQGVNVQDCTAVSTQADVIARGGGIFATTGLSLVHSIVSGGRAVAQDSATRSEGGGVALVGGAPLAMKYSEVRDSAASGAIGISGGVDAAFASDITVSHSTIAGNSATNRAGGAYLGTSSGADVNIDNTTISGNVSYGESGLVVNVQSATPSGTIRIFSTTVTANASTGSQAAAFLSGATVLNASLFSGNSGGDVAVSSPAAPEGADNLVGDYSGLLPQAGLILTTSPGLAPLGSNGGFTRTHAELAGSPAIDAGNNAGGSDTDQRGFERVVGARADIGAYERDPDLIFANGFD